MNETEYKTMVRNAFNEASAGYDCPAMRFFDLSAQHLVNELYLKGQEHVLDVAAGTGKISLLAAQQLKNGSVTGIDLSEGMLARAREKADASHLTNVSFQCGDLNEMDLPQAKFDGLFCGFGVFFWMNMEQTLKRLMNAVKPGGFAAITSFADGSFKPLSDLCLKRFEHYGVQLPKTYTWEKLDHPEKHTHLLKTVGLQEVHSHTAQMGYFLESPAEWWDVVYYSGFRGFLNQLKPEQKMRYKEEHLKEIAGQAGKDGIFLNVNVIFTTARKKS